MAVSKTAKWNVPGGSIVFAIGFSRGSFFPNVSDKHFLAHTRYAGLMSSLVYIPKFQFICDI